MNSFYYQEYVQQRQAELLKEAEYARMLRQARMVSAHEPEGRAQNLAKRMLRMPAMLLKLLSWI